MLLALTIVHFTCTNYDEIDIIQFGIEYLYSWTEGIRGRFDFGRIQ